MLIFATWCNWRDFYWCWIKFCLSLSLSLILTRIERFRTVPPVWIHPWLWNDAQRLMKYRRVALLFSKVIHEISRSPGTKKSPIFTLSERSGTITLFWIYRWIWNDTQSLMHRHMLKCFPILLGSQYICWVASLTKLYEQAYHFVSYN